jgi:prevent-host-death family protein
MATTLDEVTRTGQNGRMPDVNVTNLKAKLSHYLRLVRQGETVVVFDRDKPVAEIVPYRTDRLRFTPPEDPEGRWYDVPTGPPLAPEAAKAAMDMFWADRKKEPEWPVKYPGKLP